MVRVCRLPLLAAAVVLLAGPSARGQALREQPRTLPAGERETGTDQNGAAVGNALAPMRHEEKVIAVTFSPDGGTLASGGWDNVIRLWDPASGRPRRQLRGHSGAVLALAFAPDGKVLASAGNDATLRLWEAATGKLVRQLRGHTAGVTNLAFSPDGKLLASAGYDQSVRLWEPATGKGLRQLHGHSGTLYGLAFSPDSKLLASGGADNTICLWEPATGRERCCLQGGSATVGALAFSPDGKTLAAGDYEGVLRLWEVATARERRRLDGHQGWIGGLVFTPDGKVLASCGHDRTVRLWELPAGRPWRQLQGHRDAVPRLALSPHGTSLASVSFDRSVRLWPIAAPPATDRLREPELSRQRLARFWDDLASPDASRAYQAICALCAAPGQAVVLLRDRLGAVPIAVGPERIARLVAQLDDDRFAVRQRATAELGRLGAAAEPALRQAREGSRSLEVKRRVDRLLESVRLPEEIRELRAIETLEHIGSRDAWQVLQKLAGEMPRHRLAREAEAALARLGRRPAAGR